MPLSAESWRRAASIPALAALIGLPIGATAHERVEELVEEVRYSVVNVASVYYQDAPRRGQRRRPQRPEDFFRRFIPREFWPYFQEPQEPDEEEWDKSPEDEEEQQQEEEEEPEEYRGPESRSEGSGFIISSDGYLVTSFHVVEGADKVIVTLQDRREMVAEVVGLDRATDLALLRIDARNLPSARLGDSDTLRVGQSVLAIGSPFRLDFSVTLGVISALSRAVDGRDTGRYVPFIQSDVAINPGNSGGPLYNMEGEVIGVNAQIYTRTGGFMGLSFSVPINTVKSVVSQLRDKGKVARGWLGIGIQDVDKDLAESLNLPKPSGALVSQILEDSPAEAAELRAGDVIVEFNGKEIVFARDLPPAVGAVLPGKKARAVIYRDGRRQQMSIEVGAMPESTETASPAPEAPRSKSKSDRLGIEVQALSEQEREESGDRPGVRITSVQRNGPAWRAGLRRGDLLRSINGQQISSVEQFRELQAELPQNRPAWVQVQRGSNTIIVTVRPAD